MHCLFQEYYSVVTRQAASALGLDKEIGVIAKGMIVDWVLWFENDSAVLCYYFFYPLAHQTTLAGEWIENNNKLGEIGF